MQTIKEIRIIKIGIKGKHSLIMKRHIIDWIIMNRYCNWMTAIWLETQSLNYLLIKISVSIIIKMALVIRSMKNNY